MDIELLNNEFPNDLNWSERLNQILNYETIFFTDSIN